MIGIDTNVLVRYIAQDDPVQSKLASRLVEHECGPTTPGYISHVTLVELVWVSESCYGSNRAEIAEILRRILGIRHLVIQEAEVAWKALRSFETCTADFADCLIERTAATAGCALVMTFDKAAARAGMTLLT